MDIISKAKELGNMIAQSIEMENYKKHEVYLNNDPEAKSLLQEYQSLQKDMVMAAHENREKDYVDDIKEKLILKYDEVNDCEVIKKYMDSKEKLDNLIKKVNDVLIFSITGEESCSSSGCSSCSGCK